MIELVASTQHPGQVKAPRTLRALYIYDSVHAAQCFDAATRAVVDAHVQTLGPAISARDLLKRDDLLGQVQVILGSWGMPVLDAALLARMPQLEAVFYAAGSVRPFMTDAAWARGIIVTTAAAANARAVAEMTLSQIIYGLKLGHLHARTLRKTRKFRRIESIPGCYGSTVGLVSLGEVGRQVCDKLTQLDVNVLAYDPFATADQAAALNVTLAPLARVFAESDVVSLHAPDLPATRRMIGGELIASMKSNATLINTARGAIIDEPAMIEVLRQRSDLTAVLDVTYPEPPKLDSPLWDMDNIVLHPHIAGSLDGECARHGRLAVEELLRYTRHEPLQHQVTREQFVHRA